MTVRTDRPRIWLTPAILATLRARVARNTERWLTLKSLVDRPGQDWDIGAGNYALAYVVTGDLSYAQKALTLVQESMAAGLGQVTPDSGYPCRSFFPTMACVFDWCYPAMTAVERQAISASMEQCWRWVWPDTNASRAGQWAVTDPGNNFFHGFMTSWIAGLALWGESPEAGGILALSQAKWDTFVEPHLAGPAAGGYFVEGTSYGVDSVRLMMLYRLALLTAGNVPVPGWLALATRALTYLTTPTFDRLAPWGDMTKSAGGSLRDPARSCFLIEAGPLQVTDSQWWLDHAVPNRMQERVSAWEEFLWYPEEQAPFDYTRSWPTFGVVGGAGLVSSRSSWDQSAVQVVVSAGPTLQSHQDRAAGAFGLFAGGEWLAGWAKTTSHSGIAQETNDSNCVTIGGARQTWTQDGVKLLATEDAALYSYVKADLTAAYAGQCAGYTREYLFLKPGTLIVRDQLQGVAAGAKVVFSTHSGSLRPVPDALGYQVRGRGAALFVAAAVPANPAFGVVPLTNDRDPGVTGYRLDLGDQGGGQFLVVFETAPLSQAGGTWHDWEGDGLSGAVSPAALVVWAKNPGPWTYVSPGAVRHLIVGTEAGKTYNVPGGTAVASAGGVLMFDGPPAGTKIVVEPAGDPGPDLTRRTWNVVSGQLETAAGQTILLTGGLLVVTAIPGEPEGAAVPKTRERRKSP